MSLLFFYLGLALLVSFLCSLLEAVLLTTSHAHIAVLKKGGHGAGKLLAGFKEEIDRPLAAILTLNTIAHTVGAAGVGAQVLALFGNHFVTAGSIILTLCVLIFSEIIPKTLGATYWKKLAPFTAHTLKILIFVLYPFVIISEKISDLLATDKNKEKITREEVIVSAERGEDDGTLQQKETRVIKNLLRLNNIYVRDVMTPRSVVVALPQKLTVAEVIDKYSPIPFSRIPVYQSSVDDISGVVLRYKILEASSSDQHTLRLESLRSKVHAIQETESIATVLDEFIKRRDHIFIVNDEYGTMGGIITLEDCIETLLGVEIVDEFDSVEDMRQFALEQWEKRKQKRIDALKTEKFF